MAIEHGHVFSINDLAYIYQKQKQYELAEKYYLMAVEKGDTNSINKLAYMYRKQKRYDLAEKYYLMAIKKGNSSAINNLAYISANRIYISRVSRKIFINGYQKGK